MKIEFLILLHSPALKMFSFGARRPRIAPENTYQSITLTFCRVWCVCLRNGHLESFYHSKKLAKLTEGKIVTSFFGTFRGGFEPEMQLFG